MRRLLHTMPNVSYVKQPWMDPLHPRMNPQHLRNWMWRRWKWVVHLLNMLNMEGAWNSRVCLKIHGSTFRKGFNTKNKKDALLWLKEVIHSMRPVIDRQTRANTEAFKWYLSLNMNFCKSISPDVKTDPVVIFCSEVFKSINTHQLDYQFHVG